MPFVILAVGLILLISAMRKTHGELVDVIKSEFVGQNTFLPWALSIIILAGVGYIKVVRPVADAFIMLILLVMILSNQGFFTKLNDALKAAPPLQPVTKPPAMNTAPLGTATIGAPSNPILPPLSSPLYPDPRFFQ